MKLISVISTLLKVFHKTSKYGGLGLFNWTTMQEKLQEDHKTSNLYLATSRIYEILWSIRHGPLTWYAKLGVAHAPGIPRTFSPPPRVSDPDMHHGTCVTHVTWCMPGSLTSGFLWSQWRGKRSRRMRNPQFCVSGKRSISPLNEY